MTHRSHTRRRTAGLFIGLFCAVAVTVPMMFWIALHNFEIFNDEGYYLLSLALLAHHHPLYTQIYGTYGPAYYELLLWVFWLLHLPFSPDAARLVTVLGWAAASLLSGFVLWRACQNLALVIAAVIGTFVWLTVFGVAGELYTSVLIIPLQLLLVIALPSAVARRSVTWLVGCGVILGTILLIKVNVGVFTLAAVGITVATVMPGTRFPRWLWAITCAVALAIPPLLMLALIREPWVEKYLAGSEAAIFALLVAIRLTGWTETSRPRIGLTLLGLVGGALAACIGFFLVVVRSGTPLAVALHSTFVVPLNQTRAFVGPVPMGLKDAGLMVLVALCVALLVWRCYVRRATGYGTLLLVVLALTKVAAGGWIVLLGINGNAPFGPAFDAAWMGVAAFSTQDDSQRPIRRGVICLVAAFGVFQQLQMYPVAGEQIASGTVWFVLAGLIMFDDGLRILTRLRPQILRLASLTAQWADVVRFVGVAIVAITIGSQFQATLAATAPDSISLSLPGSSWIELARPEVQALRGLTRFVDDHCSTFFSAPGFDSLYTWTGDRPPLGLVVDDWMYGVSASEQRAVVESLQAKPRVCGVMNQGLMHFWEAGRRLPSSPVLQYLARDYVGVRQYGGFEVYLRRGRSP